MEAVILFEAKQVKCRWRVLQYIIMKCFRRGTFSTSHDLQYESRATCPFQCSKVLSHNNTEVILDDGFRSELCILMMMIIKLYLILTLTLQRPFQVTD